MSAMTWRGPAEKAEVVQRPSTLTDGKPCHHCGDKFSTMKCPRCHRVTCKPMLHDCMAKHRCGGER